MKFGLNTHEEGKMFLLHDGTNKIISAVGYYSLPVLFVCFKSRKTNIADSWIYFYLYHRATKTFIYLLAYWKSNIFLSFLFFSAIYNIFFNRFQDNRTVLDWTFLGTWFGTICSDKYSSNIKTDRYWSYDAIKLCLDNEIPLPFFSLRNWNFPAKKKVFTQVQNEDSKDFYKYHNYFVILMTLKKFSQTLKL